jgi:hypothetical protein
MIEENQIGHIHHGLITDTEFRDIMEPADPIALDISDEDLLANTDSRIKASRAWFKKHRNLYDRQKSNIAFYLGEYQNPSEEKYDSDFRDNAIYEGEGTIKPIAMSRLPDLLIKAANQNPQSLEAAEKLTEVINTDLKTRENRKVLGLAFKHLPLYFTGVIKYRWDPERGKYGDYKFEAVHPDNITFDHTAKTNDTEEMDFIAEKLHLTVKEVTVRFPKKKKEFLNALDIDPDTPNQSKMATEITIDEVWSKWFDKKNNIVHGVIWKYKNKVLLGKMLNPNYDHEGKTAFETDEKAVREQLVNKSVFGEQVQPLPTKTVFNNFFEKPEFPYIVLGYDQLGQMPYDETSRIEQVKRLQKNLDKRGRQITQQADRSRGKFIFASAAGFKQEDIEEMDMSDPDTDILIDGEDVRGAVNYIPGELPTAPLFEDKESSKRAIFAKLGVRDTTRGEVTTDTATTAQLARESDFGRIDDLVEDTINFASERMARAALQMIKLRYTEDHLRTLVGTKSQTVFQTITQDLVEDGMEVVVAASSTDKLERSLGADERARLQLTDPLSYFEDKGLSDPEGRTEKLMMFTLNPQMYFERYVVGTEDTTQVAQEIERMNGQETTQPTGDVPGARGTPPQL